MIADGGVAAVGEGAGAPVADAHHVVGVPAEDARFDPARTAAVASSTEKGNKKQISRRTQDAAIAVILGHEAAVAMADTVPHHVVAHLRRWRRRRGGWYSLLAGDA